jgi:hypothetical protein
MAERVTDLLARAIQARQLACVAAGQHRKCPAAQTPDQRRPFTALTVTSAGWLSVLLRSSRMGLVIDGAWYRRRFVICAVRESSSCVSGVTHDIKGLALAVPVSASLDSIARECQRFGARVERILREQHRFEFDLEPGADERGPGALRHIVHRYHHIALCQYRGPWPERLLEPEFASELETCPDCSWISREQPTYRARYHPLCLKPHRLDADEYSA